MRSIQLVGVQVIQKCCLKTIDQLAENLEDLCERTKNWYAHWMKERLYRITGSICYSVYTYTKKKRSDQEWVDKCKKTFTVKDFKSDILDYGKTTESEARDAFRRLFKLKVIETGLIVSKLNPWLAYSPDGIIIEDNKPTAVLEIKCPFKGKTADILETVASQYKGCLTTEGENIVMKEKHAYYAQVQLGMAVLNVKQAYFVIYSSFDKNIFCLKVAINEVFLRTMLKALKPVYYKFKLHEVCIATDNCTDSKKTDPVTTDSSEM